MSEIERHVMPDGTEVYYRDKPDHMYARDRNGNKMVGRLTSISTIVGPYDWEPNFLMRWAGNLNCDGVAELALQIGTDGWLESGEAITSMLQDHGLHWTQNRDRAATKGTEVHKHALQALAEGATVPDLSKFAADEQGHARGVIAFWHECEPEPILSEQVVCDLELGVAGRFDLLCDLTYLGVRTYAMLDAKTTRSGFLPLKHHAQLAGYEHCARNVGIDPTEVRLILQVFPDGTYRLIPSAADDDDFIAAVDIYRRAARIQREQNAALKALGAVASS